MPLLNHKDLLIISSETELLVKSWLTIPSWMLLIFPIN